MTYLYSLYDALVSIAVPADKARAVVDAMEHDMGTTLATKPDLENLRLAMKHDIQLLKQEIDSRFALIDPKFALVGQKLDSLRSDLSRDLAAQRQSIIIQLGSVIVACFAVTLALLRYWA